MTHGATAADARAGEVRSARRARLRRDRVRPAPRAPRAPKAPGEQGVRHVVVSGAVVVALWWLACTLQVRSAFVLPPPGRVWDTAVAMTASGELPEHVVVSLGRVLSGFGLAFAIACVVGALALLVPRVHAYLVPVLDLLKNVPPLALIPLLILWFGIGETPKLIVIVLTAVFPMTMSITKGLRSCGRDLLDVGSSLHLSRVRTFWLIRVPHALPDVLVGMRISLGYAWRALVGAEMIAAASGLGALVVDAGHMSRADKVLVGVITIGLVGLATDRLFAAVVRRRLRWGIDDSWR